MQRPRPVTTSPLICIGRTRKPTNCQQSGNAAAMVTIFTKTKVLSLVVDKQETKAQVLNHNITVTFLTNSDTQNR